MDTKLYVGNLSNKTNEDELRNLFSRAGTVASVILIRDQATGQSKGFAFIEMGSEAEAEQAIRIFNGYRYDNRNIKVDKARPQDERSSPSGNGGSSYKGSLED